MRYEAASANPRARGCQTGTIALARAIRIVWPELATLTPVYGCFNRRRISGTNTWSLHAEGRALDVGVEGDELASGWPLACELVAHRTIYGVQRVMWDRHIWSIERPSEWRKLRAGSEQHHDHMHIEQYWKAALRPLSAAAGYVEALERARTESDRQ